MNMKYYVSFILKVVFSNLKSTGKSPIMVLCSPCWPPTPHITEGDLDLPAATQVLGTRLAPFLA